MNKTVFIRKFLSTVLYCLVFAGGLFYIEIFKDLSSKNLNNFILSLILGIGLSFLNGFEFKISPKKNFPKNPT